MAGDFVKHRATLLLLLPVHKWLYTLETHFTVHGVGFTSLLFSSDQIVTAESKANCKKALCELSQTKPI